MLTKLYLSKISVCMRECLTVVNPEHSYFCQSI